MDGEPVLQTSIITSLCHAVSVNVAVHRIVVEIKVRLVLHHILRDVVVLPVAGGTAVVSQKRYYMPLSCTGGILNWLIVTQKWVMDLTLLGCGPVLFSFFFFFLNEF